VKKKVPRRLSSSPHHLRSSRNYGIWPSMLANVDRCM